MRRPCSKSSIPDDRADGVSSLVSLVEEVFSSLDDAAVAMDESFAAPASAIAKMSDSLQSQFRLVEYDWKSVYVPWRFLQNLLRRNV